MYLHAIMLFAVLSVDSDYPQLLQQARVEYNNGRFSQSEKLYLDALRTLDRNDEAMKEFDAAIKIGEVAGGAYQDAIAGKKKLAQP